MNIKDDPLLETAEETIICNNIIAYLNKLQVDPASLMYVSLAVSAIYSNYVVKQQELGLFTDKDIDDLTETFREMLKKVHKQRDPLENCIPH